MPNTTVKIADYQKEFLDNHPEVNLSGLVRQMIDHRIALQEHLEQPPVTGTIEEENGEIQFTATDDRSRTGDQSEVTVTITPEENNE